jgi:hypothetical protein
MFSLGRLVVFGLTMTALVGAVDDDDDDTMLDNLREHSDGAYVHAPTRDLAHGTVLYRPNKTAYHYGRGGCEQNFTLMQNATTGLHYCKPCPYSSHNQGGVTAVCHAGSTDWARCSHIGCKISTDAHCRTHSSDNPRYRVPDSSALKTCTVGDMDQRLVVFHHRSEDVGNVHRCSKTTGLQCQCMCKKGESGSA